ncbi:FKBP-type peptidyl-prolyl cis-trans isomerase [Hymenobacter arcticus]
MWTYVGAAATFAAPLTHPLRMAAIAPNSVVTLTYDLSVTDENQQKVLVEQAEADEPMVFLFGHSGLPEEFEQQLDGKNPGDSFSFSLTPEQGYGDYDQQAVVEIPKQVFEIDGQLDGEMLQVGNYLPMADNEGNHMQAKVVEIGDEQITMDFNHPLAGMVMHFDGKIQDVRPATTEELAHGHAHGDGGHQH